MFLNWIQYLCSLFVGTCADQRADDLTGRHQGRGLCPRHSDAEVYPASVTAAPLVWMITAIMGYFLLFPTLSLAD
ncbi:MAG: hypothetical protein KAG12_04665, partial [Desulfuromusa sp.]|nr:hypothetical protein [Desulfuromusa sp.]